MQKFNKPSIHVKVASIAASFMLSSSFSHAAEWDQHLKSISATVENNIELYKKNADSLHKDNIEAKLIAMKMALASDKLYDAVIKLDELRKLDPQLTESTLTLAEKIMDQLVKDSESAVKETEKEYQTFAKELMASTKPQEVDKWFVKFEELQKKQQAKSTHYSSANGWSPSYSGTRYSDRFAGFQSQNSAYISNIGCIAQYNNKTRTAITIAQHWQDYLLHKMNENQQAQSNSLRSVAQHLPQFNYIPRSKVLILQSDAEKLYKEKNNSKTKKEAEFYDLESIQPFLKNDKGIHNLRSILSRTSSSNMAPEVYTLKSPIDTYSRASEYLANGDISRALTDLRKLSVHPHIGKIAQSKLNSYLIKYFDLPEKYQATDKLSAYDQALLYMEEIIQKKSWTELQQFLNKLSTCKTSDLAHLEINEEIKMLKLMQSAQNLENAKQITRAITAYRQVVSSPTNITDITKEATDKLLQLQQAYPEQAEESESIITFSSRLYSSPLNKTQILKMITDEIKRTKAE